MEQGPSRIIDRVLVNREEIQMFPSIEYHAQPESVSDHRALIVYLQPFQKIRKGSFKFFNMWTLSPNFLHIVKEQWAQPVTGTPMYRVATKLQALEKSL